MSAARAITKLTNLMGHEKASGLVDAAKREAQVVDLDDPNQLVRFGDALIRRGGVIEAVGRAIKIQALLAGAGRPVR